MKCPRQSKENIMFSSTRRSVIVVVAVILACGCVGMVFGQRLTSNTASGGDGDMRDSVRSFTEVYEVVQRNYAEPVNPDKAIYNGAIPGMLRVLDPHSNFFDPKSYAALREEQRGKYYGVGMQVGPRNNKVIVIAPFTGAPAYRAGIRPGGVIIAVDGKPTDNMSTSDVAELLKGPKGTTVKITMLREGTDKPIDFNVVRDEIPRYSVDVHFMIKPGIGYIHVSGFQETTEHEVAQALDQLQEQGELKGLILDLRQNPGGLLANKDVDAVVISTPDHQHAVLAVKAVRAGKDVYLQKPASLTIAEGRTMSDAVRASKRIFQIGSQQRSWKQFHRCCELVRNGRIGEVKHVEVGLPGDPSGPEALEMPVPPNLNYDAWLGSTPEAYYTEMRVHPQQGFDRPGWLRCEQFGAGMITGWGAHHVDTAHLGMNTEYTGPVEIWGTAEFPTHGLWNVHGKFLTHAVYSNGVTMDISGDFPNGIKFYGTEGWIFVTRDKEVTGADPGGKPVTLDPLMASDPKILDSVIGPDEVHLYQSDDQHGNWLECIRSRKAPIAPAEIAHRACSTCLVQIGR